MENNGTSATGGNSSHDAAAVEAWLIANIALETNVPAEDIDATAPMDTYAIESLAAFAIMGDFSDWLGRELPPTLLWDYPDIRTLAQNIAADSRH